MVEIIEPWQVHIFLMRLISPARLGMQSKDSNLFCVELWLNKHKKRFMEGSRRGDKYSHACKVLTVSNELGLILVGRKTRNGVFQVLKFSNFHIFNVSTKRF